MKGITIGRVKEFFTNCKDKYVCREKELPKKCPSCNKVIEDVPESSLQKITESTNTELNYIQRLYDMPNLKKGLNVEWRGEKGEIIGFQNARLLIQFGEYTSPKIFHPRDEELVIDYTTL